MSDRDRVLMALTAAGASGVHSLDIRREGLSGNPSQRIAELRALGYVIDARLERRGKRNGTRYTLIGAASAVDSEHLSDTPVGGAPDAGLFDQNDYRERYGYADQEKVT